MSEGRRDAGERARDPGTERLAEEVLPGSAIREPPVEPHEDDALHPDRDLSIEPVLPKVTKKQKPK